MGLNNWWHESEVPSSREQREGLWKYFPLNPLQIERAQSLAIAEPDVESIRQRMLTWLKILSDLKCNPIAYETLLFMTQWVKNVDLPEDAGINERAEDIPAEKRIDAIREFLQTTFNEEHISSWMIFIAPYYMGPEHKDRFLYLFWLLYMWHKIWVNNRCFARIPEAKEYRFDYGNSPLDRVYPEGVKAWWYYTGYKERWEHKQYALWYLGNTVQKVQMPRKIVPTDIPPVFSSLGDIEPKVWVPAPERDISYLEEQYVLFWPINTHPPYKKVMEAFLRKHKDYFLADISGRCGWEEGRKFLEKLGKEPTSVPEEISPGTWWKPRERRKEPSARLPHVYTPITWVSWINPKSWRLGERTQEKPYPKPNIYSWFQNILQWKNTYSRTALKTADNLPRDAVLWIGTHGTPLLWKKYHKDEIVNIGPLESATTYSFCFTEDTFDEIEPLNEIKYPRIQIEVIPRTITRDERTWSNRTVWDTTWKIDWIIWIPWVPRVTETAAVIIEDRTDEVWLEILEMIDNAPNGIIISTWNPVSEEIDGVFMTNPVIHFHIDLSTYTVVLWPEDVKWVHLIRLTAELTPSFPQLIRTSLGIKEVLYLKRFENIKTKLSHILSLLIPTSGAEVEGEVTEIADMLESSEINSRYGWDIFMSPLHRGKFEAIRQIYAREWIDLSLVDDSGTHGKNYSIEISLNEEEGYSVRYRVSRQNTTPYYRITPVSKAFSGKAESTFRGIALDTYVMIALFGKQIFQSLPGAAAWAHRWYTPEQISNIIAWTYLHPKNKPGQLSESEKTLIHQAAQRVKNGLLKVAHWESSDDKSGLILPAITTARGILEFHKLEDQAAVVLIDEKFSCIDDEKARQIEEKWGNRRRKHPYSSSYAILKSHERSRKYFVRRMIATAKNETYLWLSPFSNRMHTFFFEFWKSIVPEKQQEFLTEVAGKGGHAGKGLGIKLADGKWLFDTFLALADEKRVPLLYSKPKTIAKASVLDFIQSDDYTSWLASLGRNQPEIPEIHGK